MMVNGVIMMEQWMKLMELMVFMIIIMVMVVVENYEDDYGGRL